MEDEATFRALVDPSRRLLLDRLFERDGQALGELAAGLPEMSRQGVMKHLRLLEDAGLIVTRREGRQKLHFLNPVPIRLIHDRWISRYTAPLAATLGRLKGVLEDPMTTTRHVYQIYINATPDRVWQAITDPQQTVRYFYGTAVQCDWQPGSSLVYTYPDGSVAADGKVLAADPPRSLTIEFNALWDDAIRDEAPVRQTWEIASAGDATRLTVTTEDIVPGSETQRSFEGGIVYIVSGLKTLVETGEPMAVGAG